MKNPHVVWASALIVVSIIAGSVAFQTLGGDVATILVVINAIAVPVLGGYGVSISQNLQAVKEQTNGNFTAAMDTLQKQISVMQETQQSRIDAQQKQIDALVTILRPTKEQ